jgi:hypothetical protein
MHLSLMRPPGDADCELACAQAEHREEVDEEVGNGAAEQHALEGGLSGAQRSALLAQLPPDTRPSAAAAVDALGGADAQVPPSFPVCMLTQGCASPASFTLPHGCTHPAACVLLLADIGLSCSALHGWPAGRTVLLKRARTLRLPDAVYAL